MQTKQKKGTTNKGSRITLKTSETNYHKYQQRTRDPDKHSARTNID